MFVVYFPPPPPRFTSCNLFHFIISGRSRGLCLRRIKQCTKRVEKYVVRSLTEACLLAILSYIAHSPLRKPYY